ncbi:MAG: hypothetical protein ABI231_08625, partial [Candidatus Tumulicola sp.]
MYGPIPLLVGVTGHRKLPPNTGALKAAVRETLKGFRRAYPTTSIVLLSSLSEGADRLVALEALDLGCTLVVPLPMDAGEYERDFETAESRAEFRALLARATSSFVVPGAEATPNGDDARNHAYVQCGAYIVRHCVELIALWDGREGAKGGTAGVVEFQLDGIPAPYVPQALAFDLSIMG